MIFFLNARYAASASNLKKGSGSSSEKAKPLKYLHVTSVQGELQLTMSGASNPHYQLCKDKAVINLYWLLEVPNCFSHVRYVVTKLKKQNPRMSFPGDKSHISV